MKNLLKSIITTVLVAAIIITGISTDTTTVTAKTTTGTFKNGGKVTLKPGDSVMLLVTDTSGEFKDSYESDYDIVSKYTWSSSDTSVLVVDTDFCDDENAECVVLNGAGAGTAAVIGKGKYGHRDITMTVTVTLPKATAKQKKCKHKYKVTKKATCERAGIKTCKKCKFQKSIKKLGHNYVDKTVAITKYKYFTEPMRCHGDDGNCDFQVIVKVDIETGEWTPSEEEFNKIMADHFLSTIGNPEGMHGTWGNTGFLTFYEPYEGTATIRVCKNCGDQKRK